MQEPWRWSRRLSGNRVRYVSLHTASRMLSGGTRELTITTCFGRHLSRPLEATAIRVALTFRTAPEKKTLEEREVNEENAPASTVLSPYLSASRSSALTFPYAAQNH